MGVAIQPPAIIEQVLVQCCPLAGGSLYLEHGIVYFTGWELVPAFRRLRAHDYRVIVRTATPLEVAKVFSRELQVLVNGNTH